MTKFWKKEPTATEREIERISSKMELIEDPTSEEYQKLLTTLDGLNDIARSANGREREKLSPNTVMVVAGSIGEILLIMHHERLHVFATKAMGRLLKGRV